MRYFEIVESLGLGRWYREAALTDPGIQNPYHNQEHRNQMIEDVYAGVQAEGLDANRFGPVTATGVLVAIYHDWGHSAGKVTDHENVAIAVAHLSEVYKSGFWPDGVGFEDVYAGIRSTEFPYVVEERFLTPLQRIVRDSDLMSTFRETLVPHILLGLGQEMGGYSLVEMVPIQQAFVEGMAMTTDWGRRVLAARRQAALDELAALQRFFSVR